MDWSPLVEHIEELHSPNFGYGGLKPLFRAVTWHIADGNLAGTNSWLCSPASEASAHFVIGRNAEVFNLVPITEAAWAHGHKCDPDLANPIVQQTVEAKLNPNLVAFSIECVGYSRYGRSGALTQVQADALVRVTAFLCLKARLSADRTHILGHYQWDSCTRSGCPGYAPAEWDAMIARVRALTLLWRGW